MGNAACGDCSSKDAAAAATESVCATGAKSVLEPSLDRQLDPSPRAEDDIENDTGNPLFLSAPSSARCMPSWDFNPIGMSSEQLCHQACQLMIPSYALCGGSKAPVLQHFIKSVADGHQPNAFHNFAHAVDALQAVCIQGALIQWKPLVTPCMRFSMAVSALAVDLGHPGVDNTFLVDTRHELACSYNDISPLELDWPFVCVEHALQQAVQNSTRGWLRRSRALAFRGFQRGSKYYDRCHPAHGSIPL
ncbi:unnamed protein product [Polarella glacialis]|uniref:PDEase domain-containing protein n=1 Tax=Polarella glacialis TaxID=89957 RepID=A0A813JY59_POLGL|nr:unnamed protein product [Polarella glacialis]